MKKQPLSGKKILFFAPRFFNYENEIAAIMRNMGAHVDLFDERPGNGFFTKALIRIRRSLMAVRIAAYYNAIVERTKAQNYDYIVFIKGEAVSDDTLKTLKQYHPHARLILYFWDSLKNNRNGRAVMKYFDRVLSFDHVDCAAEKSLIHRPLFYLDVYRDIPAQKDRICDLLFVGTVHSDRFAFARKIKSLCSGMNLCTHFVFFFQSPPLYVLRRLFDKSFRGTRLSDFRFRPVTGAEITRMVAESRAVLDVQHPHQNGLTMRTIEMLGARRKLLTTNQGIAQYDFYRSENIMIIDRSQPEIHADFFTKPYSDLPSDVYEKYSIRTWVKDVLGLDSEIKGGKN